LLLSLDNHGQSFLDVLEIFKKLEAKNIGENKKLFPNDWIKEKTQRTPNRCLQFQTRSISPLNKIYTLSFSKNIFCLLVSRAT
jgi:hypothetical protein